MDRSKKLICTVLAVLLAGVLLGVVVFAIHQMTSRPSTPIPAETPAETVQPTPTPSPTPEPTPEPTPTPYVSPIDFEALWEVNPHVIAWIEIPGTVISYPILQHPLEDNYYLNVTMEGAYGYPGSIYTNAMEGKYFAGFNTVIYGHNMSDGSMFADLSKFQNLEFMKENREIRLYTPTAEYTYLICAHVIYDDRLITYEYDDTLESDNQSFLASLHNGSAGTVWLDEPEITTKDRILTLSTCIGGMPDNRRVVIAVQQQPDNPDFVIILPDADD